MCRTSTVILKQKLWSTIMEDEFGQDQPYGCRLRKVLNVMFPQAYIEIYHQPPNSVCSIFSTKLVPSIEEVGDDNDEPTDWKPSPAIIKLEASTEPSSRAKLVNLREQFNTSLVVHQAKPIGLCPIRRAIYDQCFGRFMEPAACWTLRGQLADSLVFRGQPIGHNH